MDTMIPVEIQQSSPHIQNFVAEESNEERKVNLDYWRRSGRKQELKLKHQREWWSISTLEAEAPPVPGRRPGDKEGPPILARKQVVPQVDWPF